MRPFKRSMALGALVAAAASLVGCGEVERHEQSNTPAVETGEPSAAPAAGESPGWQLQSSREGAALRLAGVSGIHLFCPARSGKLVVNVAGFRPIASEERLSFGSGGVVVVLVADSGGDALRGGVTGEGPVPAELAAILAGPMSASYGAQRVGPLPLTAEADRNAFLTTCAEKPAKPAPPKPAPQPAAACRMQDGERLTATTLRAIGTEPFWGARIEGRCVTYSTPEDQAGTRIWTSFNPGPDGGIWSGALAGRQFELRTRPAPPPGCSDGMSDNRYPFSVTLRVRGETRTGCAKPA